MNSLLVQISFGDKKGNLRRSMFEQSIRLHSTINDAVLSSETVDRAVEVFRETLTNMIGVIERDREHEIKKLGLDPPSQIIRN